MPYIFYKIAYHMYTHSAVKIYSVSFAALQEPLYYAFCPTQTVTLAEEALYIPTGC